MNNKIKFYFKKFNYHFNKRNSILVYLLIFLGVIIPTLSGTAYNNFWNKLFNILNSSFFNTMFFIAIGINFINYNTDNLKFYNIRSRYKNFVDVIKKNVINTIIHTTYLSIISLILAISGSVIFCFGNFDMIYHPFYNVPIVYYLVFYFIRYIIIAGLINVLISLISILCKKNISIILIILNSSIFMIISNNMNVIHDLSNMYITYYHYYSKIIYSSLMVELKCSIIEIIILILIDIIVFKFIISRKRELI